jgi:hypothetical protein
MQSNDKVNINNPGVMNSPYNMPGMNQAYPSNMMENMMTYQLVYPEIFYKLQPFIMMVCDQMDAYGSTMPSQEMIEQMTDNIYDDICRMYPDIAEYVNKNDNMVKNNLRTDETIARFPGMYDRDRRRFRQRGLFRDLIDILLLSEFFRRRRRFY